MTFCSDFIPKPPPIVVNPISNMADIYTVSKLLGHTSVKTTEVYANMNLKRVSQDFPTIVSKYVNDAKIGKLDTETLDTVALPLNYVA